MHGDHTDEQFEIYSRMRLIMVTFISSDKRLKIQDSTWVADIILTQLLPTGLSDTEIKDFLQAILEHYLLVTDAKEKIKTEKGIK